ncbi:hypothetical protein BS47DRAFT_1361375 [Hydnum rufescens UP504]|uniref:Uncharacterized protein n=1 Tax=Hydnum rufescens UP504 TaxID=1448309 RepID=A0A9P6DV54_9AGAM|nr:hypothetical protein BS47DRAFT_1361375 [Hydnum rufescens UP504]
MTPTPPTHDNSPRPSRQHEGVKLGQTTHLLWQVWSSKILLPLNENSHPPNTTAQKGKQGKRQEWKQTTHNPAAADHDLVHSDNLPAMRPQMGKPTRNATDRQCAKRQHANDGTPHDNAPNGNAPNDDAPNNNATDASMTDDKGPRTTHPLRSLPFNLTNNDRPRPQGIEL